MPAAAGIVDEKGSEYILAHTGPRELDGHPLGGCGSGFGLVPGYTTLLFLSHVGRIVYPNVDFIWSLRDSDQDS